MNKNIGSVDRIIRLVVAVVLIGLFAGGVVSGVVGYIALGIAVIAAVTALVNSCPAYTILGLSSNKTEAAPASDVPVFATKEDPHKSGGCCGSCGSED